MFRGTVSPRFEPVVPIELVAENGEIHTVQAVLDTGFDGELSLPESLISELGFPLYDDFVSTMADGRKAKFLGYDGNIVWHGRRRSVLVLQNAGEPLLGMRLLWRNRITIDAYANGSVVIEELQ